MRLRLRLSPAAETAVRRGHPWVYAEKIKSQNKPGTTGEIAVVYDRRDRFLAVGLYDADSPIRVRILHAGDPVSIDDGWWCQTLQAAIDRRRSLFRPDTTGFRIVHGESDGLPGFVLDRYGDTLVLKLYSGIWLPRFQAMAGLACALLRPGRLVLRTSRNLREAAARFQLADGTAFRIKWPGEPPSGQGLTGASAAPVIPGLAAVEPAEVAEPTALFLENGIRFEADVIQGQKTGFFLDQRENRALVGELSRQADVLNAFSFSGGFSLYAGRGGARSVTDLDISPHALESGRRNWMLNQELAPVRSCRRHAVQADVFEWLGQAADGLYDVIVLDPPSMAKRESERARAIQAYGRLAALGVRRLRPGGVLVAASCSAHVGADEFFRAVRQAVGSAGRRHVEIRTTRQPLDHPATFPEAEYLKCIYLRVVS